MTLTPFDLHLIPAELRERDQWVGWRWERKANGKTTKVPYRALDPTRKASTTDRSTWATFDQATAVALAGTVDGIGFVFSPDDPYFGIDVDGLSDDERDEIVTLLDSYTECSVSGTGLHVIGRGSLNGHGLHPRDLGVFDRERYFVVTGDVVGGRNTINERQAELEAVLDRFLPPRAAPTAIDVGPTPIDLDDRELIERALAARNGDDFQRLHDGDWSGYASQSEADLAFCRIAAFWTGRDPIRVDAWMRASGLYRAKWERVDYRERTIETAIAATRDVYTPAPPNRSEAPRPLVSGAGFGASEGEADTNRLTDSALKESVSPSQFPKREPRTDLRAESVADLTARPFAMPVAEFIAIERPHREPLLADEDGRAVIGRHSLVLLGALGGHGKTTLSIDAFLHMAAGVDYPPFTVPQPVSILMIENEGPEELFAAKLAARLASFEHELQAPLDVCTVDWGSFSLADGALRDRLVAEIANRPYDLVFGDPLDSLGIEGVGSPENTREFMALMKETGLHTTVAWWLNAHPRKEEAKEALNEIAGAWGGKPDSVLLLRMLDDDRAQLRFPKLRWTRRGTRPSILLAFDADTEAFTFIGEESEEKREYLREVFAFVRDHPWLTAKEIAAPVKDGGVGASTNTVRRELDEHPDIFESRTGDEAVALGRKANATLWGLRPDAAETLAAEGDA